MNRIGTAISSGLFLLIPVVALTGQTVEVREDTITAQVVPAKRMTLAISYPEGESTEVSMVGTNIAPQARGKAEVKRKEGRARIKVELQHLPHPQSLGSFYTAYVLWAIAPEGQAETLAELPISKEFDFEVTTSFQTFGLIITAEPHSAVKLPSPLIVAENALRKGTEGGIEASRIEYSGDSGTLYEVSRSVTRPSAADYNTPLLVLGARRAVEIAARAGAERFAEGDLRQAEVKLAALEQTWPHDRTDKEKWSGLAHDVMRIAEHARGLAVERRRQARLEADRLAAENTIAQAVSEADRAKDEANRARKEAAAYRESLARAEQEAERARRRVEQAETEAERSRANVELARAQAERARLEAEQAKREKADLQEQLFVSLSEVLETRREARGLIVSLSDVLFDFNKATLKPGAREKLSKLAGILLAYPGDYRMEIEGHTDSVGSHEYNLRLSQDRADSVRAYLIHSGIQVSRIAAAMGLGEESPVATNDTAAGRQMNRRVEIVISDVGE